jgi:hypothetical protein
LLRRSMAAHTELPLSPYGDSVRSHVGVLLAHPHEGMLDLVHYRHHADDPARAPAPRCRRRPRPSVAGSACRDRAPARRSQTRPCHGPARRGATGAVPRRLGRLLISPGLLHALIHRSAWKMNSRNFAFTEFYEVRLLDVLRSWRWAKPGGIMVVVGMRPALAEAG